MEQNKYIYIKESNQVAGPLPKGFNVANLREDFKMDVLPRIDIVGEHSFTDGQILESRKDILLATRSSCEIEAAIPVKQPELKMRQEAKSFEELFNQWIAFSLPTFKKATPLISLKKLSDEIEEVANELQHGHENLSVEYVDCIMCLLDSAARAKISVEDLKAAFIYKLEKSKARSWAKNADGTYSHIKP